MTSIFLITAFVTLSPADKKPLNWRVFAMGMMEYG